MLKDENIKISCARISQSIEILLENLEKYDYILLGKDEEDFDVTIWKLFKNIPVKLVYWMDKDSKLHFIKGYNSILNIKEFINGKEANICGTTVLWKNLDEEDRKFLLSESSQGFIIKVEECFLKELFEII